MAMSLSLGLAACEKFEYSPNEVRLEDDERDLTRKNIEKLRALHLENRSRIRFAVISDTQRYYDELDDVVEILKARNDIDFLVISGDITDFGITKEYRWVNERLEKLDLPILTVIGNHDCQGNGKELYKDMFGDLDYTVNIGRNRFVFTNTNSLEFSTPVPDLGFLRGALADTTNYDQAILVSHIAPYDPDFSRNLETDFATIARQGKVKLSLHGHKHNYMPPTAHYGDGVEYLIVGSIHKRVYEEVTIEGGKISLNSIAF